MLHLVGLGLADEKDITVRGLEIVKKAERVYLEAYTAILLVDKAKLVSIPHTVLSQVAPCPAQTVDLSLLSRKPSTAAPSSRQTAS